MTNKQLKEVKKQMDKKVQKEMTVMDRLYKVEKFIVENYYTIILTWIALLLMVVVTQNYIEAKSDRKQLEFLDKMITMDVYFKVEE